MEAVTRPEVVRYDVLEALYMDLCQTCSSIIRIFKGVALSTVSDVVNECWSRAFLSSFSIRTDFQMDCPSLSVLRGGGNLNLGGQAPCTNNTCGQWLTIWDRLQAWGLGVGSPGLNSRWLLSKG